MTHKINDLYHTIPNVVRINVPLHHHDDLPQLARRFERLAFELRVIHQNEQINGIAKLGDAYHTCRALNRKLKQENPR